MGFIIKLRNNDKDYYIEWSTISDTPNSGGLSLEDFKIHYKLSQGDNKYRNFIDNILPAIEKNSHSISHKPNETVEELIKYNVCGENGEALSYDEIVTKYCNDEVKTIDCYLDEYLNENPLNSETNMKEFLKQFILNF